MSEATQRKIGLIILGRRRPGFDMEWGKLIEAQRLWQRTMFDDGGSQDS